MKVVIMRGIPGSGKSTVARSLGGPIVSADDYFMASGEWKFNPAELGLAHAHCFKLYLRHLSECRPQIVVDNTNITAWEISPYILAANAHGYEDVQILTVACDPAKAFARQLHGVPAAAHERMSKALITEGLGFPPFWTHVSLHEG